MKKLEILMSVPDDKYDELKGEIGKLLDKFEGVVIDVKVTDVKPQGAGATVRDVL